MDTESTLTSGGPDLGHSGHAIKRTDRTPLLDEFKSAAARAVKEPGVNIELVRWSSDGQLATVTAAWWTSQRTMLRRHLNTELGDTMRFVVTRRTDPLTGTVKGYVRVEGGEAA